MSENISVQTEIAYVNYLIFFYQILKYIRYFWFTIYNKRKKLSCIVLLQSEQNYLHMNELLQVKLCEHNVKQRHQKITGVP